MHMMDSSETNRSPNKLLARSALRPYHILRIFLPFIFSLLRDFRGWFFFGAPRPITSEEQHVRARDFIAKVMTLGPTFVKFGQILATRDDLIPQLYTNLLRDMHDRVPSFPFEDVHRIIETDFGKPLSELFDEFDSVPFAGASLGQVHRAVYKGDTVAVKVLRPGVEELVLIDLYVIRVVLKIARWIFGRHFIITNLSNVADEFRRVIHDEMDFLVEAQNYEEISENLKDEIAVRIPCIYHDMTSHRVLTMEYIDGIRLDDKEGVLGRGVDPMELVRTLVRIYTKMIAIDGVSHADPHPGNLLLDSNNCIVMLDFGMVVRMPSDRRRELVRTISAAVREDVDAMVQGFYKLNMVTPGTNMVVLRDAARVLMDITLKTQMSTGRIVQKMVTDILSSFYRFPLNLPSNLVYLLRIATILEGIGIQYKSDFNGVRFARPIIRRVIAAHGLTSPRMALDEAVYTWNNWLELGRSVDRVITKLDREELKVGVHPTDMGEIERYFAGVQRRMIFGMLSLAISIVVAIVFTATHSYLQLILGELLALFVFMLLLVLPVYRRWR